jgi:hypothetical protein
MADGSIAGASGHDPAFGVACHCAFANQPDSGVIARGSAGALADASGIGDAVGGGAKRSPWRSSAMVMPSRSATVSGVARSDRKAVIIGDVRDQLFM